MKKSTLSIPILFCLLFVGGLGDTFAQTFDISSGGAPTITGSLGGSVTGSSSVLSNLVVTLNFGELSPANINNIVKVVVPIAVRSNGPYRVVVSYTGASGVSAQAVQRTDIGFGAQNLRAMGSNSRLCTGSNHIFYAPFTNDPATSRTIAANGRAAYPGTLNNLGVSTTILTGPRLSNGSNNRELNDGYIFDTIFAITPQYFAPGTTNATLTFTISAGPNVPC
jgi:spore coat protein U-like protein